jgi:hypothetical protein
LVGRRELVPLNEFQRRVLQLLASNRSPESHLAGGAALHIGRGSPRFTNDVDLFHDTVEAVSAAYRLDRAALESAGIQVREQLNQQGIVRVVASQGNEGTKIEWVHDSAWRFMPVRKDPVAGYVLHPVDLAINKVLALAGRDEPRDFLDTLYVHRRHLSLGALCWASSGKDPGFNPGSLLEMLARKGRYHAEDFSALQLASPVNLEELKQTWLEALDQARVFVRSRPAEEAGCLYYNPALRRFVEPRPGQTGLLVHRGRLGGVIPHVGEAAFLQANPEERRIFEEGYEVPDQPEIRPPSP